MPNANDQHTLRHALYPAECRHTMADIKSCVICGRDLKPDRRHVDTCAGVCFIRLCNRQRAILASDAWCRCTITDENRFKVEIVERGHSADSICLDCGGARSIG